MNKTYTQPVSIIMRLALGFLFPLIALLTGSCSTSRTVDADLELEPGSQVIRSVIDSDILIPEGSSLRVDYTAGNRFFVESGGTLSGLNKGAANSTIYAEPGALVPAASKRKRVKVVEVVDAEESYRERFKNLLPAGAENNSKATKQVAPSVGLYSGGYYGYHNHYRHSDRSHRSARAVSVQPKSYRAQD